MSALLAHTMKKTTSVRVSDEALKLARIASGYTGESVAEYISRVVADQAKQDSERLHAEEFKGSKPKR
jgi:hypothetical protein